MELVLKNTKEIKEGAKIIVGFPNVGMVGSIVIEHMLKEFSKIGFFYSEEMKPIIVAKDSEIIEPVRIFYNKNHNIVLIQSIFSLNDNPWEAAEDILKLQKKIKGKEIIVLDGILTEDKKSKYVHYLSKEKVKLDHHKLKNLDGSLIIGLISSLFLLNSKKNIMGLFAESNGEIQDDMAASHMIEVLNEYLGTNIETASLIKNAKEIRSKVNELLEHSTKPKEELNYFI